jgi:hypothetical protein
MFQDDKVIASVLYPYLSTKDIFRLSATCKQFRIFICNPRMPQQWRDIFQIAHRLEVQFKWIIPNPTFAVVVERARGREWCLKGCGRTSKLLVPRSILPYNACTWCCHDLVQHRNLRYDDSDEQCMFCWEWCSERSQCNIRYNCVQGEMIGHARWEDDEICRAFCDECYDIYEKSDLCIDGIFRVDCNYRMND